MLNPVKPVHVEAVADLEEGQRLDGWRGEQTTPSLAEVFGSIRTRPTGSFWHKLVAFLGPGYLVAVRYMDPGNWATSLAGGSKFGYALLSIALLSNVMAIILQALCARLGVASGRDLAQACRDVFPRYVSYPLWAAAELAICATDLAEVIGTAIGLNLLFGIPLEIGVILTALDVFLILWMQRLGFRWIEAFIVTMLGVIAICFGIQIAMANSLGPGDPRLRPHRRDREEPRHALSRAWHSWRHGDAAQPLSPFRHRADARFWEERGGQTRGDHARHRGFHYRADVRAHHQRRDPDPRRRHLPSDRADQCCGARSGAFLPRPAARFGLRADAVRHRAALLRTELDGDRDVIGADRHGRLPRHPTAALAQAARHPRPGHYSRRRRHHLVWRGRNRKAPDPEPGNFEPAASLRYRAARHVHGRQGQDGSARGATLGDRARGPDRGHRHHPQCEAALGLRRRALWRATRFLATFCAQSAPNRRGENASGTR
jgi:Natural resistance-associated macrophage protein-like